MNLDGSGTTLHYNSRGYSDDTASIAASERTLEGDFTMHVDTSCHSASHVPFGFRRELENMVGSIGTCSVSSKTMSQLRDDADVESISGLSSVFDDDASTCRSINSSFSKGIYYSPNAGGGDWQSKQDWLNGNVGVGLNSTDNNAGGRGNFLLQGRHHSMYVSSASTFADHLRNSFPIEEREADSLPPTLPLSVATIHRRLANPRVPVFDGQTAEKVEPEGTASLPTVGMHRNNSLPRPHSYAATQNNFMKYRLSLARKRDLV